MTGARSSEVIAFSFNAEAKTFDNEKPILLGFRAMSELLLCDHTSNVFNKYAHFNEGKKLLEEAIKRAPGNAELIYFRFTTQTSAPRMLGYYHHIKADKLLLFDFLKSGKYKDLELYNMIKGYLANSSECSKEEKDLIKKIDER